MRRKFWTLLTAIAIILAPKTSSALILKAIEEAYNVIPLSPVINFGEDIAETGKLLNKTAMKVQKLTIQIKKDIINLKIALNDIALKIEALFAGDFGVLTGLFSLSEEKEKVEVCGVNMADTNHDGMAGKLQEILLTYGIGEKEIVDRNRRKFYLDNVYNIYAAVQVLRYNLSDDGDIGQKITAAQLCCGEGQGADCGLPVIQGSNNNDDEGLIEMQMYYGYALGALENLIKTWERVAALKAQLQAVETIMDIELKPDFSEDTTDTSWVEPAKSAKIYASAQTSYSQPLAFAQMIYNDSKAFDFEEIINEDDQTTSPGGFTGMGLKFSRPESTLAPSAFAQNKDEMESYREITDIENTLSKAISIHGKIRNIDEYQETAKQLKSLQEQYAKKLKILEDSNQCGRDYVARYFLSPDEVWTGMKRKLTSEEINNYDIRKGISGWAIDAYEFAKAAEVSDFNDNNFDKKEFKVEAANYKSANEEEKDSQVTKASGKGVDISEVNQKVNELSGNDPETNPDDLAEETIDDNDQTPGKSNLQDIEDNKVSVNEDKYNKGQGISEEKSKATQDENRKATMIAWHIGALASEDLGLNAGPSTDAENPQWGITNDRKMIWRDAKIFYDQYLEHKYSNIKAYLKRYIEADIIELFISVLKGQVKDINQTAYQQKLKKLHTDARAALDAQVSEVEEAKTKASDDLEQQKKELETKINQLSEEVKNLTQEIAGMVFNAEEGAYTSIDEIVSTKINYLAEEEDDDDVKQKQALDNLKENSVIKNEIGKNKNFKIANNTDDNGQTKSQKEGLLRQKQVALEAARKELDDVNQEIAAAILDAQEQAASSQNTEEISEIIHNFTSLNSDGYNRTAKNNLSSIIETVFPDENLFGRNRIKNQIKDAAKNIIINLNDEIDKVVDEGLVKIHQLGDDLYLPESSNRVKEIHKEIITKLEGIAIVGTAVGYSLPSGITLASLITMDTDPDDGFFVGAIPAERDFKSPRPMEDFSQPPVREVFHFDMTDFANIKPYDEDRYKKYSNKVFHMSDDKKLAARAITRGDFLNYGGKVPDLWKMMLQRKAFIETEFKLQDALNQGCEDVALLRGGIMPCRVVGKNKTVVLDVYAFKDKQKYTYDHQTDRKYITRTDLQAENLPKCILIDMDENDNIKLTYYDIDAKINHQSEEDKPPFSSEECKASELGMILDADENNNIYFKAALYELYNDNFRAQNDKSPSKDDNRNLAISEQAQLSRNQIGDFLRQAESEKKMKQSLEEMEKKKENQMAELKELFEDKNNEIWAENAPRPKFDSNWDLTDNTIIDQIKSKLRIAKETILEQVTQLISAYKQNSEDSEKNTAEASESSDKDNERAELIKNRLDELQKLVEFLEIKSNVSETKKDKKTGQNVTYYNYKNIDGLKGKGKYQYPSEYINVTMNLINEDDWQNKANAEINEAIADESAREEYDGSKKRRKEYEGDDPQYRDLEEAYCANY